MECDTPALLLPSQARIVCKIMDTTLKIVGFVRSSLKSRAECPRQGSEGAPDAWLELEPKYSEALDGLHAGNRVLLLTWLHKADRKVLRVHPRDNLDAPLTGVFATRSPDRPNPIGLHEVEIMELDGTRIRVQPLEALDGTPIVDIKPVLICKPSVTSVAKAVKARTPKKTKRRPRR